MASIVTIHATYGGDDVGGKVTLLPNAWRVDADAKVIYPQAPYVGEVIGGVLSVGVPGTDDNTVPAYQYTVTEALVVSGVNTTRASFEITLPLAGDGVVLDLADVQPDGTWPAGSGGAGGFGGF